MRTIISKRTTALAFGAWQVGVRFSYLDLNDKVIQGGTLEDMTVGDPPRRALSPLASPAFPRVASPVFDSLPPIASIASSRLSVRVDQIIANRPFLHSRFRRRSVFSARCGRPPNPALAEGLEHEDQDGS
jgi:hypothetical protein